MAEVSRRKESAAAAAAAAKESEKLRTQSAAAARMVAELQAANAGMRAQLHRASGTGAPGAHDTAHVATLEGALARKEAEVHELRQVSVSAGIASFWHAPACMLRRVHSTGGGGVLCVVHVLCLCLRKGG